MIKIVLTFWLLSVCVGKHPGNKMQTCNLCRYTFLTSNQQWGQKVKLFDNFVGWKLNSLSDIIFCCMTICDVTPSFTPSYILFFHHCVSYTESHVWWIPKMRKISEKRRYVTILEPWNMVNLPFLTMHDGFTLCKTLAC